MVPLLIGQEVDRIGRAGGTDPRWLPADLRAKHPILINLTFRRRPDNSRVPACTRSVLLRRQAHRDPNARGVGTGSSESLLIYVELRLQTSGDLAYRPESWLAIRACGQRLPQRRFLLRFAFDRRHVGE